MTRDTRIDLFLMGELVAALSANDPDLFKRCLLGGVQDLGKPMVEEQDRLTGWHLGGTSNPFLFHQNFTRS